MKTFKVPGPPKPPPPSLRTTLPSGKDPGEVADIKDPFWTHDQPSPHDAKPIDPKTVIGEALRKRKDPFPGRTQTRERERAEGKVHTPRKPSTKPRLPFDPNTMCGAQLRNQVRGRYCQQFKGHKTSHVGEGRCWLHGGLTPIKNGLGSLVKHGRLKDLLRKMAEIDHDVMDLTPEVELLRAMTIDYVSRYEEFTDHLETWYDALDDERSKSDLPPIPRKFPTLEDAGSLLEGISRVVERMHKITREGSITLDVFRGLMTQMGMIVAQEVSDPDQLTEIERKWSELLVNPRSFVKEGGNVPKFETED